MTPSNHEIFNTLKQVKEDSEFLDKEVFNWGEEATIQIFVSDVNELGEAARQLEGISMEMSGLTMVMEGYNDEDGEPVNLILYPDEATEQHVAVGIYRGILLTRTTVYVEDEPVGEKYILIHKLEVGSVSDCPTGLSQYETREVIGFPVSTTDVKVVDIRYAHDFNKRLELPERQRDLLEAIDLVAWDEKKDIQQKIGEISELIAYGAVAYDIDTLRNLASYLNALKMFEDLRSITFERSFLRTEEDDTIGFINPDGVVFEPVDILFSIGIGMSMESDSSFSYGLPEVQLLALMDDESEFYIPLNQTILLEI